MKKIRSASSTACRVWRAIAASMPCSPPVMPPVSMTTKACSPNCPRPYCRSRVSPGTSATRASRLRVSRLNRVDLPTLGRPTSAITGIMAVFLFQPGRSALGHQLVGGQPAVVGIDIEPLVHLQHGGPQSGLVHPLAGRQAAVALGQQVE